MATTIPYSEFLGSHDPYPVLGSTIARIAEACKPLTDEQIAAAPRPGKWSIHQITAHLADNELMLQSRVRLMLFQDNPQLVPYDQDIWVDGWSREKEAFSATLERFRVLRESTIRLFRNTPDHDLRRTGVHPERGVQTAGDYLIIAAGHDINHLGQVDAISEAFVRG